MAMRRYKLGLQVDDRTSDMSMQALLCRSRGHKWEEKALSRKRFLELLKLGQSEENRYCDHGCGSTWRILFDVANGDILEQERVYPKGDYLMPKGTGRLKRPAARVAAFARRYPEYA